MIAAMADALIRRETEADYAAIAALVVAAFGSDTEARLVGLVRASPGYLPELTLVAVKDHAVAGHVMVSCATRRDGEQDHRVVVLAPLAVVPEQQGQGIGTALVEAVSLAASQQGESMIVLQGDPAFYGRLGFEPAAPLGITQPLPDWAAPEASQVLRLDSYDPAQRGRVIYPPAVDVVE